VSTSVSPALPERPTKDEIARLSPFDRLGPAAIRLVDSRDEAAAALGELLEHAVAGFDTESRPTFFPGEVSAGPHVVQFATADAAWVFQLHREECRETVARLLAAESLVKVGFGLDGDRDQILRRFGVEPAALVDLNQVFHRLGHGRSIGAKGAVALMFGRRLFKSKKLTTSNWAASLLSESQLVYAANDAFAAIRVCHALGLSEAELVEAARPPDPAPRPPRPRRPRTRRPRPQRPRRPHAPPDDGSPGAAQS